jgi:LSD1 subclass zinc finger protein
MSLAILITLGSAAARPVRAAELEKLLMPGELSSAHAKLEENSSSSHARTDRKRQTRLCLDCHKDVAGDVARKAGLHGRLPNIASGECKACHSEHLGRKARIVKLLPAAFDHAGTDFRLDGAHATVACGSCHAPGKKFRDAATSCGACHRAVDVHRGALGADCGACHATTSWRGARFDHDKTRFPLHAAHRETPCAGCHSGARYAETPRSCNGCHAPDDVHRGARGVDCADCHAESGWKNTRFDHAKETGFALLGRHAAVDCAGCHRSGRFEDELPRTCIGCHRATDGHAGRFGEDCASCHGNESWRHTPFDHAAKTKFALLGSHARLDCHACHTGTLATQKLPMDCAGCHRGDDVHAGAQKVACDTCHGNDSWRDDLHFDHDLGNFPLLGLHVVVGCGQCHASRAYAGTARDCVACHRSSDVHSGALGRDCAACHSPNGWRLWDFNHNEQTKFALTGAHGRLRCGECHRRPAGQVKLPTDCAACHRDNDIHLGQFGVQCQRCHSTLTFKGARIQ